jgi:hypothetical protein
VADHGSQPYLPQRAQLGTGRRERYVGGNMTLLQRTVNGQPGLVAQQDGVTVTVFAFEIASDRIKRSGPYATRRNSAPGQ